MYSLAGDNLCEIDVCANGRVIQSVICFPSSWCQHNENKWRLKPVFEWRIPWRYENV